MSLFIKNIQTLVHTEDTCLEKYSGKQMSTMKCINNAFLLIENDRIAAFGSMNDWNDDLTAHKIELKVIDATGRHVFPSWCDAHTHIVYAGTREIEFVDRINGLTYDEIFKRGGGILNSANKFSY